MVHSTEDSVIKTVSIKKIKKKRQLKYAVRDSSFRYARFMIANAEEEAVDVPSLFHMSHRLYFFHSDFVFLRELQNMSLNTEGKDVTNSVPCSEHFISHRLMFC